jgi:two-component system response regulator GlrR
MESTTVQRGAERIVGSSELTQRAVEQATAAARAPGAVLIVGQPGAGKLHFARAIHSWSPRAARPLVIFSAAGSPASRQPTELFGRSDHAGVLAQAGDGTLIIKGIDELSGSARATLLQTLETGSYRLEDNPEAQPLRCRILMTSVSGELTAPHSRVDVTSLAERSEDVPALAAQFLATSAAESGIEAVGFTPEARRWMVDEPWVGNVRELQERVRQALLLAGTGAISIEALMLSNDGDEVPSFKEAKRAFETRYVESLLRRCRGNISRAARLAKKDRKDFYDVIRRTGVNPQEFRS